MKNVKEYIDQHKDRFINELIELLKIPSISADSAYKMMFFAAAGSSKEQTLEAAGAPQY